MSSPAPPFLRAEDGEIVAGEPRECPNRGAAERAARGMVRGETIGASPSYGKEIRRSGEFKDGAVIAIFGEIPSDLEVVTGMAS